MSYPEQGAVTCSHKWAVAGVLGHGRRERRILTFEVKPRTWCEGSEFCQSIGGVWEKIPAPIGRRPNNSSSTNSARISAMTRSTLQPGLNVGDAQDLLNLWGDLPSPRAILTSPPYLDTHDYGNASRIGAQGQDLDEYLVQMLKLFRCCYRIASADATLWLVAGAIRRNKRLIPLPDRLASCAEEAGWKLRESITWDKQKALPWTHHGEMRDITEQVLLFSKEEDFRFDPTELRSPLPNSVWWRRYPERYSPDGAMPTNLWSIPIPTQGSWSGTRTHFCPARPGLDAIDCKVYDG